MATVVVRGLDEEGPGDVVGALAGETGIDPEAIGEITIEDGEAIVELAADQPAVEAVIETMDGGQVGASTVSVRSYDEDNAAIREYVTEYSRLVELEREAEMRRHEEEIRSLSGREREAKGRALLDLDGRDEGEELGGYEVKFVRATDAGLPETEIGVGDLAMVSKSDPLREDNPTGTVRKVTGHSITVSFESEPQGFVFGEDLRLDLYVNDVTYQRMEEALNSLPDAEGALAHLRDVLVGIETPRRPSPAAIESWDNEVLNDSQREAVRRALGTEDFGLIHGPPGTGKTTTAIEVLCQCIDRGESVLATAASNTAVDNLVELLAETGENVLRVGHPARVSPALHEHTLDSRLEDNDRYYRSREKREAAFDALEELKGEDSEELTKPTGQWRRGLSDERIRELAAAGESTRGIPAEKIESMAAWLDRRAEIDELFDRAEELEAEAIAEEIEAANAVCTTNATAGSDRLADEEFDTLVIDEATQATEPSCLIPMVRADRVVLAGDHRQLPPTIRSEQAAREGLDETLFERLAEREAADTAGGGEDGSDGDTGEERSESIRSLLRVQYRMHEAIQDFSAERFYDGQLRPDDSVREHTLRDLGIDPDAPSATRQAIFDPGTPLAFVDTAGIDAAERQRSGSPSRENPREAALAAEFAAAYVAGGLDPGELAIISPYADQVDRIEDELEEGLDRGPEAFEVDTVDGFQGREKETVIVSLVRSNPEGAVGFLDDDRRFNVALTRARRKAIVIGDGETISSGAVFADFLAYARARDAEIDLS